MTPISETLMLVVRAELPRMFLLRVAEEMNAAYAVAKRDADSRASERPLYTRRLGQVRHFEREEALVRAAQATGLTWVDACPRGYPKVFIETPRLRLTELKVAQWGDLLWSVKSFGGPRAWRTYVGVRRRREPERAG